MTEVVYSDSWQAKRLCPELQDLHVKISPKLANCTCGVKVCMYPSVSIYWCVISAFIFLLILTVQIGEKTNTLSVNNWCPIKREKFYFGFSYVVWSDRNKGTTPPWIHKYSDGLLARLCAYMPACLLACLSACMSICLFVCLPVCLSICLSACMPACLPACLSVCLFVCACLS